MLKWWFETEQLDILGYDTMTLVPVTIGLRRGPAHAAMTGTYM